MKKTPSILLTLVSGLSLHLAQAQQQSETDDVYYNSNRDTLASAPSTQPVYRPAPSPAFYFDYWNLYPNYYYFQFYPDYYYWRHGYYPAYSWYGHYPDHRYGGYYGRNSGRGPYGHYGNYGHYGPRPGHGPARAGNNPRAVAPNHNSSMRGGFGHSGHSHGGSAS